MFDLYNLYWHSNGRLLHLMSLDDRDSGHYTCVASNAAGTAEYDFDVTVLAPPTLTYKPQTEHTGISSFNT